MTPGRHIREACSLLNWNRFDLQRWTALPLVVIDRAMTSPDGFVGTLADDIIIRQALHRAGIDFGPGGARLREKDA